MNYTNTPLENVSQKRLEEVLMETSPLIFSGRDIEQIWFSAARAGNIHTELLQFMEIDLLLDAMLNKCYDVGVEKTKEQIDNVTRIKDYIQAKLEVHSINLSQQKIIRRLEKQVIMYEIENRTMKATINEII